MHCRGVCVRAVTTLTLELLEQASRGLDGDVQIVSRTGPMYLGYAVSAKALLLALLIALGPQHTR